MSDIRKLHVFDLTFEEIDALSQEDLKDVIVRTLQRFDLHKGAYQEIARMLHQEFDYMRVRKG